jgi:hypothetical protein
MAVGREGRWVDVYWMKGREKGGRGREGEEIEEEEESHGR